MTIKNRIFPLENLVNEVKYDVINLKHWSEGDAGASEVRVAPIII